MMKLLLSHVPLSRRQYYGARALAALQELVEVVLHEGDAPLDPQGVIAAARDADFIISDRATPVPAAIFESLPRLKVVMRSAIDIRNIDVAAASKAGVLVTHAEAGFVKSVVELTVGLLVDLSRGITRAATAYHEGRKPEIKVGRQLSGSTVGIIGYGRISRELAPVLVAMGMTVLVSDPYAQVDDRRFRKLAMEELLGLADYVICLAVANEETENLLDEAAFARMKPDAFFINMSRGNLVDEAALLKVLTENRIAGAALDVGRAPDQMPSPELARLANVIATPHIGGLTPPPVRAKPSTRFARSRHWSKARCPRGRRTSRIGLAVVELPADKHDLFAAHVTAEDVGDYSVTEPGWYALDDGEKVVLGPFASLAECERNMRDHQQLTPKTV